MSRAITPKFAFAAFTVAQLVSIFGDRLHQFSVVGMIGRVAPGSAIDLFLFALFGHLPILIFAPILGSLIDRANKTVVLIVVDVFRGAIVALIPALYHWMGSLYAFYIPVFFLSLANLLFGPAKSAAIPEYFGSLRLLRINAILWGLGIVGSIGGFIVGGWLFDFHTWELSFYSDSASYLVSVVFLLPLLGLCQGSKAAGPQTAPRVPPDRESGHRGVFGAAGSFRDALALVRSDRRIAYGLIAQTSLLGVFGLLFVVGVARVQELLPAGRTIYLSIVATAGTVGLLVGSVATTVVHGRATLNRVTSLSTLILGLALIGISQVRTLAPLAAWTFALGVAFSPIMVATETLLQTETPAGFRGRVFAVREVGVKMSFLAMSFVATLSTAVVDKAQLILGTGVLLAVAGVWLERKDCLRI